MIFMSVDLPAPFSPTNPWISPGDSLKSTSRSAATPPNALVIPESSSSGGVTSGSDQEVRLHPHHPGRVRLGDDRAVGDDVLRNAARPGLFPGDNRCDAGNDGAPVNATGRIAHRGVHPSVSHRGKRRRHGITPTNQDFGSV